MIYTVQVHEGQEKQFKTEMENSDKFEIREEIAFGAFQVDGPENSVEDLREFDSIYAANREGPIRFGDD